MHKGRHYPQVVPQYLSQDCTVPDFAPVKLALHGTIGWFSDTRNFTGDDFAEAVVDVDAQKITWSGHQVFDVVTFDWIFTQDRSGDDAPIRMRSRFEATDGSILALERLPGPNEWSYRFGSIAMSTAVVTERTGGWNFWHDAGVIAKLWR